tara:strand:- start:707 stop:1198 length:492 start_codon:yes stop_codon:yes gene_type:complete
MNKADLYKAYKALEQSHMKIEMELNELKEWKSCAEDVCDDLDKSADSLEEDLKELKENMKCGIEITKKQSIQISLLKEEHQKLLDDIELHPDYEETIKSTIEEFIKSMKEKIDEDSDDESNPPCVTCGGCHGRFVDGESYCDDWDCVNSDEDVLKPTPQGNKD